MHSSNYITWNKSLSIGNTQVDNDHKKLINIYKDLVDLVEVDGSRENFAIILSKMTDYCLHHFEKEEKYMLQFNYPNYEEHKRKHEEYSYKVAMLNIELLGKVPPDPKEIALFIAEWWEKHILNCDIHYEKFKKEINSEAQYNSF